jgi:hypothetical protein
LDRRNRGNPVGASKNLRQHLFTGLRRRKLLHRARNHSIYKSVFFPVIEVQRKPSVSVDNIAFVRFSDNQVQSDVKVARFPMKLFCDHPAGRAQ